MDQALLDCVICGGEISPENGWAYGHNALPITTGRCCEYCNLEIVLPRRLADAGFLDAQITEIIEEAFNE